MYVKKGMTVKVLSGRNTGMYGVVHNIKDKYVYVIFPGSVLTSDGDIYPDEYWVHIKNIEAD